MAKFTTFWAVEPKKEPEMSTTSSTTLKIGYSVWQKHKKRGDQTWYCRVRERGVPPLDVCLHTTSKAQADAFLLLRKNELMLYNSKVLAGEVADPSNLLRRSTARIVQKGPVQPILIREALDAWEQHLRRTGRRETTISTYMRALRNCLDQSEPISAVTDRFLSETLRKKDGCKSATRKMYSVSLREWTKFLCKEYGLSRDLVDSFEFVKVETEEKGYWSMNEIRRMADCIKCKDEVTTNMYKAWVWLMAVCGCRQGEASKIEWSDIQGRNLTLKAQNTKSGKTRTVPMPISISELIHRLPRINKYVFPYLAKTQSGRYSVIARAVTKAGIPHGGLHTLRHSASMFLYSKIQDIKVVAQILGHSESTALKYYQKTREAENVVDAVDEAYSYNQDIPSTMDWMIENDLI